MKIPNVTTIDFETKAIEDGRPAYPPEPVGVSIMRNGKAPKYYAWGHPTGNNCSKADAKRILAEVWKTDTLLFHHGKFDIDVAQTHMGMGNLPWERYHDTLFLIFLHSPHAASYQLKPCAETFLGIAPEERDAVRDWLIENKVVKPNDSRWGAHICKAPAPLVGKYADGDVKRTFLLFRYLLPLVLEAGMGEAYDRERKLMRIFLENERQGIRIDMKLLRKDIEIYHKAMFTIETWLRKRLKAPELNIDSDAAVGNLLDQHGIVSEWTMTKTGKRSVSKKYMTSDKFNDIKVFYALSYRNRLKTCLSMFMEPWLAEAEKTGGYIHPTWNQVRQSKGSGDDTQGTRTGRPSCTNPNLLNVSKSFYDRGDNYEHPKFIKELPELPLVRRYTVPDQGGVWAHRDYNQQELRLLAHFEDGAILKAYKENPLLDVHTFVQEEIRTLIGRLYDRSSVKTTVFGRIYGQGLGGLAEKMNRPVAEVKSIRDAQNRALPGLKDLEEQIKEVSRAGEPIITWGGRVYYVEPPKYVEKFGREMTFEYKLLNYLIQGSAADATKEAIIRYDSVKKRESRFLVTVYDEINISAPKNRVKEEMKILKDAMESIELDVPMISDGKIGKSWGDLTKYKETR